MRANLNYKNGNLEHVKILSASDSILLVARSHYTSEMSEEEKELASKHIAASKEVKGSKRLSRIEKRIARDSLTQLQYYDTQSVDLELVRTIVIFKKE